MFYAINAGMSATPHINAWLRRLSTAARLYDVTVIATWRAREFNAPSDALANGTHARQSDAYSLSHDYSYAT